MEKKTTTETAPKKTAVRKPGPIPAKEKPVEKAPAKKAVTHLDDHVRVAVRSNQFGGLVFVNSSTRDRIKWSGVGDIQELTVADLRNMRANARRFFEEPWVEIEEVTTPGYEDISHEQLLSILGLTRYYDERKRPANFRDVFDWDVEKIKTEGPKMNDGAKENVAVALKDAMANGEINALDRIRAWEEVLGYQIIQPVEG